MKGVEEDTGLRFECESLEYAELKNKHILPQNEVVEMRRRYEEERNKRNDKRERFMNCHESHASARWEAQLLEEENDLIRLKAGKGEMEIVNEQLIESDTKKAVLNDIHVPKDGNYAELQRHLLDLRAEFPVMKEISDAANFLMGHTSEQVQTLKSTVQQLEREKVYEHPEGAREDLESARAQEELHSNEDPILSQFILTSEAHFASSQQQLTVSQQHKLNSEKLITQLTNEVHTVKTRLQLSHSKNSSESHFQSQVNNKGGTKRPSSDSTELSDQPPHSRLRFSSPLPRDNFDSALVFGGQEYNNAPKLPTPVIAHRYCVATHDYHAKFIQMHKDLQANEIVTGKDYDTIEELKEQLSKIQNDNLQLQRKNQDTVEELKKQLREIQNVNLQLWRENQVSNEIRRKLHNRVIQLSGNIRVFVRVRPIIESEMTLLRSHKNCGNDGALRRPSTRSDIGFKKPWKVSTEALPYLSHFHFPAITADRSSGGKTFIGPTSYSDPTKQTIEITEPHRDRGGLKNRPKKWKYGFDRVFNPQNTQDDIWEGASPLVQSCIDGYNVCMFAYGQTGSGKTFTMMGDDDNYGIIPRSVKMLHDAKHDMMNKFKGQGQDVTIGISVELLEIYNDEVYDMLSLDTDTKGKLVKIDLNGSQPMNNIVALASSPKDIEDVLKLAKSRRCVKATKINPESSRSHLLFSIHFEVVSSTNKEFNRNGCLCFVDLAGSERVKKSGSQGDMLTEAKHINKSLSALTGVIEKLQARSEHIPYRDSKLTYLLRNSLGGDSKTLAIVCCSPLQEDFKESHYSLMFAAKASKVQLKERNKVHV